jgi:ribonuclease P protein component
LSLPKSNRVLRSAEFRQIYDTGVRMTSRYFAAFCLRSAESELPARFGFTVPRAVGKAVVRNRLKRRMREAVRHHLANLPVRCSIVLNPRRNVLEAPFQELCHEIGRILARCKEL